MPSKKENEKQCNNGDVSVTCKLSRIINLYAKCGTPLLRAYKWQKFLPFLWMCIKFVLPLRCSPMLTTPNKVSVIAKDCSVTSHSRSQEQNVSQKVSVTLQWNTECSMDSTSLLQNVHNGESIILNLNSFSLVNTILFNSLYWNSRALVSM